MYEIPTIGGGQELVTVFNAIAAWTGGGGYRSFLQAALVLSFTYALICMAFSLNWRAFFRWFVQIFAVYLVLMVPTVSVRVDDKTVIDPNAGPQVVNNVPIGLAALASLTSEAGFYLTETAETLFSISPERRYHQNGYIFGAKLFQRTNTFVAKDAEMRFTVVNFIDKCVLRSVALGYNQAPGILDSSNLLSTFQNLQYGALTTEAMTMAGSPTIQTCSSVAAQLGSHDSKIGDEAEEYAFSVYTNSGAAPVANSQLLNDLPIHNSAFYGNNTGVNGSAIPYMRQVSMVNMFNEAWAGYGGANGDAFTALRSDIQARNTYSSIANQAMTWVPLLHTVLKILFYALFPIIFPLFFLPTTGIQTLRGYLTGFFYLSAWGPIYAILNMFVMARADSYYQTLPGDSITINNYDQILSVGDDLATMAGYLLILVPVLAAGAAKGANVVAGQASAMLRPAQGAAEIAATETTTGNYSYGNVQYANRTANMVQGNKFDNAPSTTYGAPMTTQVLSNGTVLRRSLDGGSSQDASQMMGRMPEMVSVTSATRAFTGERKESSRAFVESLQASHSRLKREEASRGSSSRETSTFSSGNESSQTSTTGSGTDDRSSERTDSTVSNRTSNSNSSSESEEKRSTAANTEESSGEGKWNVGAELGGDGRLAASKGVKAGGSGANLSGGLFGRLSGGYNQSWSDRESESQTDSTSNSSSTSSGQRSEESVGESKTTSQDASSSDFKRSENAKRDYYRNDNSFAQERVEAFSQMDAEAREIAIRRASEKADRWAKYDERVNSEDFAITGDLTQPITSLYEQYRAEHPNEYLPAAGATTKITADEDKYRRMKMDEIAREFVGGSIMRDFSDDSTAFDNGLNLQGPPLDLGDRTPGNLSGTAAPLSFSDGRAELMPEQGDSFDARPLTQDLGLGVKSNNVNLRNMDGRMAPALQAIAQSADDMGLGKRVITSANDSPDAHMAGSSHGRGQGVDVRGRDLSVSQGRAWAANVRERLGDGYFVDFETFDNPNRNHLHVQMRR